MTDPGIKPLVWIGPSKASLLAMPEEIQDAFGYAIHLAQVGKKSPPSKPLKGFGSAGILEVVESWRGDAYRAVYAVKFSNAVYVLHCFQKKSRKGIGTPKIDLDQIRERLKTAQDHAAGK